MLAGREEGWMKQRVIVIGVIVLAVAAILPVSAQSVGGGLSFWVPESLYLGRGGSVGVESGLGSSMGFGKFLSLPFGIAYNKVYGLLPEGASIAAEPEPWAISDSLLAFVMVKARLPLGSLYLDLFGGGAGVWNMSITPLTGNIQAAVGAAGPAGTTAAFIGDATIVDGGFGWGWQAGGGFGANIGPVAVDLNVTYRVLRAPGTVTGSYYEVDTTTLVATKREYDSGAMAFRLAGFSIGIDASFEM